MRNPIRKGMQRRPSRLAGLARLPRRPCRPSRARLPRLPRLPRLQSHADSEDSADYTSHSKRAVPQVDSGEEQNTRVVCKRTKINYAVDHEPDDLQTNDQNILWNKFVALKNQYLSMGHGLSAADMHTNVVRSFLARAMSCMYAIHP